MFDDEKTHLIPATGPSTISPPPASTGAPLVAKTASVQVSTAVKDDPIV